MQSRTIWSLLIPIEGFQEEHDFLRGKNSFQKVIDAVDRLLELREQAASAAGSRCIM